MKHLVRILSLVLLLLLSSCGCELGSVEVESESPPHFIFDGNKLSLLFVYRIPRKYLNQDIPFAEFDKNNPDARQGMKNNPDMQWVIEGDHNPALPITYGSLPEG